MSVEQLVRTTSYLFNVEEHAIFGDSRLARVAEARQVLAWALRQENWTLEAIGQLLRRDHTTIMYAVKAVEQKARNNTRFAEKIAALTHQIEMSKGLEDRVTELEARLAQLEAVLLQRELL